MRRTPGAAALSLCLLAGCASVEAAGDTRDVAHVAFRPDRRDDHDDDHDDDAVRIIVSGSAGGVLRPGGTAREVDLMLRNPQPFPVTVTSVTIRVERGTTSPACDGPTNLVIDRPFTGSITVPARSTITLSSATPTVPRAQWPSLRMPGLPVNQDACKGVTFTLRYAARVSR